MWDFADVYKKDQFAFSYLTLHEWVYKKRKGKTVKSFLKRNSIERIALCGFGSLGEVILPELLNEQIDIPYIVDKNPKQFEYAIGDIPVISPAEIAQQKSVDAMVICHVYYFNMIADQLESFGVEPNKILSLNDIVFSL